MIGPIQNFLCLKESSRIPGGWVIACDGQPQLGENMKPHEGKHETPKENGAIGCGSWRDYGQPYGLPEVGSSRAMTSLGQGKT